MSEKTTEMAPKPSIEQLRAGIRQTRAELGETVQALAARADVKARALDQVELARQRVREVAVTAGERVRGATGVRTDTVPLVLVFAGLAAVLGTVLIVRGRRR